MAEVLAVTTFKDAAADTEVPGIKRPWKNFWPPSAETHMQRWRKTDSPEFLDWRFDHEDPFNRPWRSYVRTEAAKKEEVYTILSADDLQLVSDESGTNSAPELDKQHAISILPVCCSELETQIQARQLPIVQAEAFNYLAPLPLYKEEKPYLSRLPFLEELRRSNIVGKSYSVKIHNVRGNEDLFSLDTSGFEFRTLPFQLKHWSDDRVRADYIPFLSRWLTEYFECQRVFIYAYNFRGPDLHPGDNPWKKPFYRAHCDATEASCKLRMELHFPNEIEKVLGQRYRFVNIWRSITPPDQDCPLALCDYRTTTEKDFIKTDVIFPHCCDEGYDVLYSPAHRWFYQKSMTTDEVIIFKLDDSADGVAKCTAHGAFDDPTASTRSIHRASIEVRAIIVGGI